MVVDFENQFSKKIEKGDFLLVFGFGMFIFGSLGDNLTLIGGCRGRKISS
jgi:hypothetical protein